MTIKPEPSLFPSTALLTPLCSGGLLALRGPDAPSYAQAQFANDVQALGDGQWQWNLWLSAKGRVIALFVLLRADAQNLYLWLPDYSAEALGEQLARLRFRKKLDITPLPRLAAFGAFAEPARLGLSAHGNHAHLHCDRQGQLLRAALSWPGPEPRCLVFDEAPEAMPDSASAAPDDFHARWQLADIAHGLPHLAPEQSETFTPHMLGLERLPAFSTRKGCYPGQEIVARTHFLGQAKRGLVRLALNRQAAPDTLLSSPEGAQARLLQSAAHGQQIEALAVATLEPACPRLHSDDGLIQAHPLPFAAQPDTDV